MIALLVGIVLLLGLLFSALLHGFRLLADRLEGIRVQLKRLGDLPLVRRDAD